MGCPHFWGLSCTAVNGNAICTRSVKMSTFKRFRITYIYSRSGNFHVKKIHVKNFRGVKFSWFRSLREIF